MDQSTSDLVKQLHNVLLNDDRTREENIEVLNTNGIITLRGTVRNQAAKDAAKEIVQGQPGVFTVVNEIDTRERI